MFYERLVKASKRKRVLFACACCRDIWHLLTDERSKDGVIAAEKIAGGADTAVRAPYYAAAAADAATGTAYYAASNAAAAAAAAAAASTAADTASFAASTAYYAVSTAAHTAAHTAATADYAAAVLAVTASVIAEQELFFADITQRTYTPDPHVLAWNDGIVRHIAQGIYQDRAFGRMPILADALLDAGCDDEEVMGHCRSTSPHVLGCWVLDGILGKQ